MPKTKKTSLHPKKGEPKNAPVTRARANTSTTTDTASTRTGAASTSGGVELEVDRETHSASPSYTTADTSSTGAEAPTSSGGLECKSASAGAEATSSSGGLERKTASTGAEAASTSGGLERKSQSKASVDNTDSLCKVGICPIPNEEYDADELLSKCFGMNPNVSAINYGSADNDDDAFYKENALFGDDSCKDLDLEELVVDDMMPKKGRGGGRKLSPGRQPPPDTDGFTEQEAEAALNHWRWDRKKYVDKICWAKRKAKSSMGESLAKFEGYYTGVCMDLLHAMTKVALFLLMEGHTFPNKEILLMWIAEEANILCVQVRIKRSDQFKLVVKGLKGKCFHVQGTCGDKTGWKVFTCITRETPFEASVAKPAPELPPDEGYVEEGNANNDIVKEKHLRDRTPIKL
jgi:hypothetical protein